MIIHRNEPGQGLAGTLASLLGGDLSVAIRAYDGSHAGPSDASATIVIRSPDAVRRVLSSLGELGMARAYVAGDIELDRDTRPLTHCSAPSRTRRHQPAQTPAPPRSRRHELATPTTVAHGVTTCVMGGCGRYGSSGDTTDPPCPHRRPPAAPH